MTTQSSSFIPESSLARRTISASLLALTSCVSHAQLSFQALGFLPGGTHSSPYGISADGTTVVGYSENPNSERPVSWQGGIMTDVGTLPRTTSGIAEGASDNGAVLVGVSIGGLAPNEATRWENGAATSLGFLSGGHNSEARDVTPDGLVAVGWSTTVGGTEATLWTKGGGPVGLGDLGGKTLDSEAYAVSFDGTAVAGYGNSKTGKHAMRWTAGTGMVDLGHLAGGTDSEALGISGDGSVVVGVSSSLLLGEAFRWDAQNGMVGLGTLQGHSSDLSLANGVSGDGSLIVGRSSYNGGIAAVIWDQVHGWQSLQDILTNSGVDLTGWELEDAGGISADGHSITGYGKDANGNYEAWLITGYGAPVPEPSTYGVVAAAVLTGLVLLRRRRHRV